VVEVKRLIGPELDPDRAARAAVELDAQLGLAPADGNTSNIVPLKTNETTFSTIDIAGANTRTVAAWTRKNGHAWFFKLTGPSNGVEKEKPNFVKFVQSVRF